MKSLKKLNLILIVLGIVVLFVIFKTATTPKPISDLSLYSVDNFDCGIIEETMGCDVFFVNKTTGEGRWYYRIAFSDELYEKLNNSKNTCKYCSLQDYEMLEVLFMKNEKN